MAAKAIRLAIVGVGKIARDAHVPAISGDSRFELVATASRHAQIDGLPGYPDIETLLAQGPELDAVSICTPPSGRVAIASAAIDAGLDVMLEKPPATTLGEVALLADLARAREVSLFTSWHSRAAAGVEKARDWLVGKRIDAVCIDWREDIRRWHPGQEWILAAGGFGVFDPGINALSILSHILPEPAILESAVIDVPAGRQAPIAAQLLMRTGNAPVHAAFDFLQSGPQTWDIAIETDAGPLRLTMGGRDLTLCGERHPGNNREYPALYSHFATLIAEGKSDVDVVPLRHVADAFMIAERRFVEPFLF